MISANNVNKIANEAAARIKEEDTKLVQKWMDKIDLEKRIMNIAKSGLYTFDIDIKECPNFSIFKQIMIAAGYEVGIADSYNAIISWRLIENYKTILDNDFTHSTGHTYPDFGITTTTNTVDGGFTF